MQKSKEVRIAANSLEAEILFKVYKHPVIHFKVATRNYEIVKRVLRGKQHSMLKELFEDELDAINKIKKDIETFLNTEIELTDNYFEYFHKFLISKHTYINFAAFGSPEQKRHRFVNYRSIIKKEDYQKEIDLLKKFYEEMFM